MGIIAIPIFNNRVSPVFDSCTQILLIEINKNREISRNQMCFEGLSLFERLKILQKLNVSIVICGGVSDFFYKMVKGAKIPMIEGIAGEVEEVLIAHLRDRLHDPNFFMPGFKSST